MSLELFKFIQRHIEDDLHVVITRYRRQRCAVITGREHGVDTASDIHGHKIVAVIEYESLHNRLQQRLIRVVTQGQVGVNAPVLFLLKGEIETVDGGAYRWWDAYEVNMLKQFSGQAVLYTPARGTSFQVTW